MKLNRRGITRDVFLIGRYAIKVPTPRYGLWSLARGLLANQSEAAWTTDGNSNICPVLWSFYGIVNIYPRCDQSNVSQDVADALDGPLGCPPPDRKPENIGRLDGKLVWLDYDYSWNGVPREFQSPHRQS